MKTHKIDSKTIKSYVNDGVECISIDQTSMAPSWLWNVVAHVKEQSGFIFIDVRTGKNWNQLTRSI